MEEARIAWLLSAGEDHAPAAVLLRRNEQVEIPGARRQVLGEFVAPHRGIDRVRIANGHSTRFDNPAQRMAGIESDVHFRLGGASRPPPGLDVRACQPAADQVPVGAARGAQTDCLALARHAQCPDCEVRRSSWLGPGANFAIIRDTGIIDLLV